MSITRIDQRVRVQFGMVMAGWLPVTIHAAQQTTVFVASYAPDDSLQHLIDSLIVLLTADGTTCVTWYAEPTEYDFTFTRTNQAVHFTIIEFENTRRDRDRGQRLFDLDTATPILVHAFWRALRDVQTREAFEQQWHRPFPHAAMEQLTSRLQAIERS